jgi:hypothetical protein
MQNLRDNALMSTTFKPPLAIHFIWHPSDNELVDPILDSVRTHFARDVDRPFSRGLNIPLFFYSSECPNSPPLHAPQQKAAMDILCIFTSINTLGHDAWKTYIHDLTISDTMRAVPIALDRDSLGQGSSGSLSALNFIRAYQWPQDSSKRRAIVALAHEIYRHGFVEIDDEAKGNSSSIKIFLSHAKAGDTGRFHAEAIKSFIDDTNMSHFFDTTDISPGFRFDEEIIKHIKDSTLVAISSDAYSSRYWCQREILCAKEYHRPIVAVDCLENYEDRIFPAGANVPCVHVSSETPLNEPDILRILTAVILETIRHHFTLKSLEYYQSQGWIDIDCTLISRPPEIRHLLKIKNDGKKMVCYPEPPIYVEEADWHSDIGVEAFTPLWCSSDRESLNKLRVGISISDVPSGAYFTQHLHLDHLMRLAQDVARHLLARSTTLIYGGDLRANGFTQFILDEAIALKNRLNTDNIHVENHLAWPLYITDAEITAWRARYCLVMKTIEHDIPSDVSDSIDKKTFLPPTDTSSKYIWSRCLTEMRLESIESSDSRICAGGKLSGYNGKMPGVLEEILIAIDQNKPIYLLGAFGGVVGEVCKSIISKSVSSSLTEEWQISHNSGYQELQAKAQLENNHTDYKQIRDTIEGINISELANRSGLDEGDYLRLVQSPFIDECVHLIVKGLKRIVSVKVSSKEEEPKNA